MLTRGSPWRGSIPRSWSCPGLIPRSSPGARSPAAQLAETFGLRELEPAVRAIVVDELAEPSVRAAAARTLTAFHPDPRRSALIRIVADPKLSIALREAILTDAASADRPASKDLVGKVARELPARLQAGLAEALAETSDGAELLLTLIEAGSLAASHLQSAAIQGQAEISRRWPLRRQGRKADVGVCRRSRKKRGN